MGSGVDVLSGQDIEGNANILIWGVKGKYCRHRCRGKGLMFVCPKMFQEIRKK